MFRISYALHQEDCIVRAALCGMFFIHLYKQFNRLNDVLDIGYTLQPTKLLAYMNKKHQIRLHVQYSLPEDEHKMFETCRRQEELN